MSPPEAGTGSNIVRFPALERAERAVEQAEASVEDAKGVLENAAVVAVRTLVELAGNPKAAHDVRLRASEAILDRVGLAKPTGKDGVTVNVGLGQPTILIPEVLDAVSGQVRRPVLDVSAAPALVERHEAED